MAIESFNALDAAPASDAGALSGGALAIILRLREPGPPARGSSSVTNQCSLFARFTGTEGGVQESMTFVARRPIDHAKTSDDVSACPSLVPQRQAAGSGPLRRNVAHSFRFTLVMHRTPNLAAGPRCRCSKPHQLAPAHQGHEEVSALRRALALAQQRCGSCAQRVRLQVERRQSSPALAAHCSDRWRGSPALLLAAQVQVGAARMQTSLEQNGQEQATAVRRVAQQRQSAAQKQAGMPTA